jgi:hypothetical protein
VSPEARRRVVRRGDNIPDVSEYAHWGEEAQAVWYTENKYDMEHADEILEDEWEGPDDFDDDDNLPNHPTDLAHEDVPWGEVAAWESDTVEGGHETEVEQILEDIGEVDDE